MRAILTINSDYYLLPDVDTAVVVATTLKNAVRLSRNYSGPTRYEVNENYIDISMELFDEISEVINGYPKR